MLSFSWRLWLPRPRIWDWLIRLIRAVIGHRDTFLIFGCSALHPEPSTAEVPIQPAPPVCEAFWSALDVHLQWMG